jgi:hypothetical protein
MYVLTVSNCYLNEFDECSVKAGGERRTRKTKKQEEKMSQLVAPSGFKDSSTSDSNYSVFEWPYSEFFLASSK